MLRKVLPLCLVAGGAAAAAACDLATLTAATDSYIAAQAAGSSSTFSSLSSTVSYTENFKTADISKGILSQPLKIDHNHTLHDTTACATYTELIVTDARHPYVIGSQAWLGPDGKVAKVETIVTDKGDWLFNASATLRWASQEDWGEIPAARRDSRQVIQAAADAYADIFSNKSVVVPWGTPCDRLEGGSYTGTGSATDSCNVGIPNGVALTNRRYVIDESKGSVDLFITFAGNLPDSHEFRIEGGKIRYVHTLTVMNS